MKPSVQTILQTGLADYLQTNRLPGYLRQALRCLLHCRTALLGGHTEVCPEGHVSKVWYNSCRHRSCPQCAFLQTERWLAKKSAQLLPCDHFHVVFTLPSELRLLWRWNQAEMTALLFRVVRDTLFTLLGDPAHLGARPGVLAALHTWGRSLILHPHIHCLVTGGGLAADGTWKSVRNGFLLPVEVVRTFYRGKVLHALEKLLEAGQLQLPPDLTQEAALALLKTVARKKWNVRIQERYEHGRGVATYLARYMRGGPIKNHRLVACDSRRVTFRYGNHREADAEGRAKESVMTLPIGEFLDRLLLHVPLPGTQVVRGYGLYSRTDKEALGRCREQLGPPPEATGTTRRRRKGQVRSPLDELRCCPVCGRPLVRGEELPRSGAPPPDPVEVSHRAVA
jgi:hypothetical protein